MNQSSITEPAILHEIERKCKDLGFDMASDKLAGSLLRNLTAAKPGANILELGTGIGASLCWMVDGMDQTSKITSIDNDPRLTEVAWSFFGHDRRVDLVCMDGDQWILSHQNQRFDLIFADAWPGKYHLLNETFDLLKPGGLYVVDDMIPQSNWPEGHEKKSSALLEHLGERDDVFVSMLEWSNRGGDLYKKNNYYFSSIINYQEL